MLGKNLIQAATGAGGAAGAALYIEDTFQTWLYTGNGSTQTITNGIDLAGEGGMVWIKARSSAIQHGIWDTNRGASKWLETQSSNGEVLQTVNGIQAFLSNGFTVSGPGVYNDGTAPTHFASWTFRKAPKFFDVVTYTGTGANRTVAHNLGSVPGCIIVKRTDTTGDWQVYHRANTASPETDYLVLNSTAATVDDSTRWNDTLPTDSVFSLGTDATVNTSGGTYVAYLFAHDAGGFGDSGNDSVVKCGSYTEPTNGTYIDVNLGWEPQWILWKRTNNPGDWWVFDTQRGFTVSGQALGLFPNASTAEQDYFGGTPYLVPNSTGFTVRGGYYGQGSSLIYIAIRRGPMKTPTSGTEVFGLSARSGTGADAIVAGGQVADLAIIKNRSANLTSLWATRLTSLGYLFSASTNSEGVAGSSIFQTNPNPWDIMDGVKVGTTSTLTNASGSTFINYLFRRAPGFLDIVTYTGTGIARTVAHNLGVAPELMIFKNRELNLGWIIYAAPLGNTRFLQFDNASASTGTPAWNDTSPTTSVFTVGTYTNHNANNLRIIAYLFATCPGVSKCFSFTGTGTTLQVDCGFTNGARFVIIKRTDSTGDWHVWDSARGIISGNDPYLLLNSTAAEVTNTDYIDPYSAGFEISSTAPAAINASGGSYIGLAIA